MAHANFINIRKSKGKAKIGNILADGAHFATHIAGRFFDGEKIHQ